MPGSAQILGAGELVRVAQAQTQAQTQARDQVKTQARDQAQTQARDQAQTQAEPDGCLEEEEAGPGGEGGKVGWWV